MLVFSADALRLLARTFSRGTGLELTTIGYRSAANWQLFTRLERGCGCSVKGAEAATRWLVANWPDDLPWPKEVPDLRLRAPMRSLPHSLLKAS
jgi:hypothetical protein